MVTGVTQTTSSKAMSRRQGTIILSGEGVSHDTPALAVVRKVSLADTTGLCEVVEAVLPALTELPLHFHRRCAEAYYVLAGEVTMQLGSREATLPAGSFAHIPHGGVHGMRNVSAAPCTLLWWFMAACAPASTASTGETAGYVEYVEVLCALPYAVQEPDRLRLPLEQSDTILV